MFSQMFSSLQWELLSPRAVFTPLATWQSQALVEGLAPTPAPPVCYATCKSLLLPEHFGYAPLC